MIRRQRFLSIDLTTPLATAAIAQTRDASVVLPISSREEPTANPAISQRDI
jgi:hypothetical protein